jgi:hypothetical protein
MSGQKEPCAVYQPQNDDYLGALTLFPGQLLSFRVVMSDQVGLSAIDDTSLATGFLFPRPFLLCLQRHMCVQRWAIFVLQLLKDELNVPRQNIPFITKHRCS